MRAPDFWHRPPEEPGFLARALSPLGWIYGYGTARRLRLGGGGYKAKIPVICVGNINAGGTGKTPVVIALAERLMSQGLRVAVVSRGHGGRLEGPVRVDPGPHTAADVGDEPILVAAFTSVYVSRDRAAGVQMAEDDGAQIVLMDDGLQNPAVVKDVSLVVVDAEAGFGNGRVLPAGPLREPIEQGLSRGDLLISVGPAAAQARFERIWGAQIALPRVSAELKALQTGMDWSALRVLAFAGIGRPEKFFQTLRDLGAEVAQGVPLADHQVLTTSLLSRLSSDAAAQGLQLVTTEKDAVRLPKSYRQKVLTLPVRLQPQSWEQLDALLEGALAN